MSACGVVLVCVVVSGGFTSPFWLLALLQRVFGEG